MDVYNLLMSLFAEMKGKYVLNTLDFYIFLYCVSLSSPCLYQTRFCVVPLATDQSMGAVTHPPFFQALISSSIFPGIEDRQTGL